MHFIAKPTAKPTTWISTNTKTVTSVRKTNPVVVNIEDDEECITVSADDAEITLTEDKIGKTFAEHFIRERNRC